MIGHDNNEPHFIVETLEVSQQLKSPGCVFIYDNSILVTDRTEIYRIYPNGNIVSFINPEEKSFTRAVGIVKDSHQNLFVTDFAAHRIMKISPNGRIESFAGKEVGDLDGYGMKAKFNGPSGIAIDSEDNIYVCDFHNRKVRKITPKGVVSTFAGNGLNEGKDGYGTNASFSSPNAITIDKDNNLYVADSQDCKIRKISNGMVTTFAGSSEGYLDGPCWSAQFSYPAGIAFDGCGNLIVCDVRNNRIRQIGTDGQVITVAGSKGGYLDGDQKEALFNWPLIVTVDPNCNLFYIVDFENEKIRKMRKINY